METVLIGANSTKVENGPKRELPHLLATLNILYSQFQANGEDIDSQSGQVPIYSSKIEASYRKKTIFIRELLVKTVRCTISKAPKSMHRLISWIFRIFELNE